MTFVEFYLHLLDLLTLAGAALCVVVFVVGYLRLCGWKLMLVYAGGLRPFDHNKRGVFARGGRP